MSNPQNLKPGITTTEEAKKRGRNGGIASGKARRERKTFRELAEVLGSSIANEKTRDNVRKVFAKMKDKDITYDMAIVANNILRAANGDPRACEWLLKVHGENNIDITSNGDKLSVALPPLEIIDRRDQVNADDGEVSANN
ncbi:MAG: hypothetical protein HUJ96_02945 [Marinilabiliaceae bacterium]|nr:hypothetical protein [Marinilabiliaceae bacterium]